MTEQYNDLNNEISELITQKLWHLEEARRIDNLIDFMRMARGGNRISIPGNNTCDVDNCNACLQTPPTANTERRRQQPVMLQVYRSNPPDIIA